MILPGLPLPVPEVPDPLPTVRKPLLDLARMGIQASGLALSVASSGVTLVAKTVEEQLP